MKNYSALSLVFAAAVLALLLPVASQAQNYSYYNQQFLNYALVSSRAQAIREGLRANSGGDTSVNNVVRGTTTFSSTGSLIIPKEIAQRIGKTAQEKREAETGLTKGLKEFEGYLKNRGYAANDVARSSSLLFLSCVYVYQGKQLMQKQVDGVYKAFKNYYETDKRFQSLTDKERQKIYEMDAMMWSVIFINAFTANEKGDRASDKKAKDTAEYVFEQFIGVPINKVRMKTNGFEID
jgi:hypothetical protein